MFAACKMQDVMSMSSTVTGILHSRPNTVLCSHSFTKQMLNNVEVQILFSSKLICENCQKNSLNLSKPFLSKF